MTFDEALKAIKEGKMIRRTSWDSSLYIMSDGNRMFNSINKADFFENFSSADILASDWEASEPQGEEMAKEVCDLLAKFLNWREVNIIKDLIHVFLISKV